jgi:hypothetical protein
MIREYEYFHGAVFTRLMRGTTGIKIEKYTEGTNNASYVVNGMVGLYIKHSTNRLSPWVFTFKHGHQEEIRQMYKRFGLVFTVLVCSDDGMVCLSYPELKLALDELHNPTEWVKVARRTRQKYTITGSDGKLKTKVGENEFPLKLLQAMDDNKTTFWSTQRPF